MLKLSQKLLIFIVFIYTILEFISCKKDDDKTNVNFIKSGFNEIEKNALSGLQVNSIMIDDNGYKWIGNDSGLFVFDNSSFYEYNQLKNAKVFNINKDNNKILISTSVGAYTLISGHNEIQLSETIKGIDISSSSDTIYVYSIDKYGNAWLGSQDGLSYNNGSGWLRNKQLNLNLGGLKEIRSIAFRNNEVFFSTYGKFLYHLKLKEANFDAVSGASQMIGGAENPVNNFNGQLTTDTIFYVYTSSDSALWFGSEDGLTLNKGITHVSSGYFEYFLRGERVHFVIETSDKKIWACAETGLFVKSGEEWIKYTGNDGLPSNIITSIAEDIDRSVWLGSDKGLSHYINGKFTKP